MGVFFYKIGLKRGVFYKLVYREITKNLETPGTHILGRKIINNQVFFSFELY